MAESRAENKTIDSIAINRTDLPLSCPRPSADAASEHPRVFLPIEKTGEALCPYCGARYHLAD
jgi:uncharacterized Zn-finger protein